MIFWKRRAFFSRGGGCEPQARNILTGAWWNVAGWRGWTIVFLVIKKNSTFAIKMEMDYDRIVELLLEAPYWVIDFLPMQVPQDSAGQFFAVEQYYLQEPQYERLCRQFADVLLKLNCYHDLLVSRNGGDEWLYPDPRMLEKWLMESMQNGHLCVLIDDGTSLITASGGDTNLTLYNPSPALLELVRQLATAAGLFLWQPPK